MQQKTSFVLMVLLATASLLQCLVSHVLYPNFSDLLKIVNPRFVTSNNVCKLSLIEVQKHFEQWLSVQYSYPSLVICQYKGYPSGRKLWQIQNTLQNEMHRDSDMPTALAISRIVYLSSLSIISQYFKTFVLPVTVPSRPDFVASLTRNFFLYLRTVS